MTLKTLKFSSPRIVFPIKVLGFLNTCINEVDRIREERDN